MHAFSGNFSFCPTGYSFLASKYNLMYQCIMPNCRLTIANLRKHCDLSDEVEEHILESSCMRICCQRLLDFMLDLLNTDKDYMKFCYLLFLSTVVTDLPCQLISSKNYVNFINVCLQKLTNSYKSVIHAYIILKHSLYIVLLLVWLLLNSTSGANGGHQIIEWHGHS